MARAVLAWRAWIVLVITSVRVQVCRLNLWFSRLLLTLLRGCVLGVTVQVINVESVTQLRVEVLFTLLIIVRTFFILYLVHLLVQIFELIAHLFRCRGEVVLEDVKALRERLLLRHVDRLQFVELFGELFELGHAGLVIQLSLLLLPSNVAVQRALQVEQLLIVPEVFKFLCPVRRKHPLVVAEDLIVQLKGESLAMVLLGDEACEQVTHLLLEVVLEDLLDHDGEVLLNSCYLLLNLVDLVRCLINDDPLLFHLEQHSVL